MDFQKRPEKVTAHRWYGNGDHPDDYKYDTEGMIDGVQQTIPGEYRREREWEGDAVRFFRRPDVPGDQVCTLCDRTMHEHGWVDSGGDGQPVCPGDYIITVGDRKYKVMKPKQFEREYAKYRG